MLKGQNKVFAWRVHYTFRHLKLSHWRQDIKAECYSLFPLTLAVIVMGIISDTELKLSSRSLIVDCNLPLCFECCKESMHTWEQGAEEILALREKLRAPKPSTVSADFIFLFANTGKA